MEDFFLDWSDDVITKVCSTIVVKKVQTRVETVIELVITRNNNRNRVIHLRNHLCYAPGTIITLIWFLETVFYLFFIF